MERKFLNNWCPAIVAVVLSVAVFGLTGCCPPEVTCPECPDCTDEGFQFGKADHWIAIHDKVKVESSGGIWEGCVSDIAEDDVGFIPACMHIKSGEKVGFANFSATDVTFNHYGSFDASNPIEIPQHSIVVVKAKVDVKKQVLAKIESIKAGALFDHGGPEMIVEP